MGDVGRRRFLLWGAATGAGVALAGGGGLAAVSTGPGRRALHALGLLAGDDRRVPKVGVPVQGGVLSNGRRYRMARTGRGTGPVPSVVCLHGRNNDETLAFEVVGFAAFAVDAGLDIVVGSLDGGRSSYWHRRRDPAVGDPLGDMVHRFLPLVDQLAGGGPRHILGWSMGGYGALLAAQRHADVFSSVVAASPAVWRRASDAAAGAFDDAADFAAHDVLSGMDGMRVPALIHCGRDDPFADVSKELLRRAPAGSAGGLRTGFHDAQFWRTLVDDQLAFITARPGR